MKTFTWNQNFVTGLDRVDEQHHFLVDLINRFGEALVASKSVNDAELANVFGQLTEYAHYHFSTEESLMLEWGVAPLHREPHCQHHADFISQVSSMWNARATMSNPAEVLQGFLCSWLAFHVLGEDKDMGCQIALLRAGKSPDEAFELAPKPLDNSTAGLLGALRNLYGVLSEQNQNLTAANVLLGKRVKELRCLHEVSELAASDGLSVQQIFEGAVHRIPPGWLYPEISCARIVFRGQEFATANFRETPWKLCADIALGGVKGGTVEVGYLEQKPVLDEGPFMKEEQTLICTVASQLGGMAERKHDGQRNRNLLDLIELADSLPEKQLLQKGLDMLQELTNSRIGFLHFVSEDQNEIDLVTWTTDTMASYCNAVYDGHYPVAEAGMWAQSVRQRRAVVVNDYPAVSDKSGLPPGHAHLQRFVSVPIFDDGLVRMIVGMGNAAFDYCERDVTSISLFANDMYRIVRRKRAEQLLQESVLQLERAMLGTIDAVSRMMHLRDPYTSGHQRRVGEIAAAIGAEMGLDANGQRGLRVAGGVHDVGKITVPAEILGKPGRISEFEFDLIKTHAQQGYEVLKSVDFPWPVAEVAHQHHERVDGSGYPRGLKGSEILLEARVLAVADVVEAMASHRPYRPGLGIDKALAELERGRGTAYDANVVDACLKLFRVNGYAIPT